MPLDPQPALELDSAFGVSSNAAASIVGEQIMAPFGTGTAPSQAAAISADAATSPDARTSTDTSGKPSVAPSATVEWDHKGRVIRSRFSSGHLCEFRYDQQGSLYAFTYARLAWSTTDGVRWTAVDHDKNWILDGTVDVWVDGTLRIGRLGMTRAIHLNGMIADELEDGTRIESPRTSAELYATDLLAVARDREDVVADAPEAVAHTEAGAPAGGKASVDGNAHESLVLQPETAFAGGTRKFIAQGVRIKRSRPTQEITEEPPSPPASDLRANLKAFLASSQLKLIENLQGPASPALLPHLDVLAERAQNERRIDEARLLHERALTIRRESFGSNHAENGLSLHGLGKIYHGWGRFNEAEQAYLEAIRMFDNGVRKARFLEAAADGGAANVERQLMRLLDSLHSLASLYHENKNRQLCEQLYNAAVHACDGMPVETRANVQPKLDNMAAMCAQLGGALGKQPDPAHRISRWVRKGDLREDV